MHRAIFLDRDGVINRKMPEDEYVTSLRDFELLPGSITALSALASAGFLLIIVTNQRGIARGKVTMSDLEVIHAHLKEVCSKHNAQLTEIYYCPHEGGCHCRKPEPGLILQASCEFGIDLRRSWMIGDSISDIEAGRRAGCKTAFIGLHPGNIAADVTGCDLAAAARAILGEI